MRRPVEQWLTAGAWHRIVTWIVVMLLLTILCWAHLIRRIGECSPRCYVDDMAAPGKARQSGCAGPVAAAPETLYGAG